MHPGRIHAGTDPHLDDPQAARANKLELIERIADDLAHEIKNPLHSMVINLEVLKRRIERAGGSPPEELLRYVGVLGSELDRVSRRVELLLRLVRGGRGAGEPGTLDGIVGELLELLDLQRERRGVTVSYEPCQIPTRGHLPLDPSRQLVLGLLLDVMELLPNGSSVRVRTEMDDSSARLWIEGAAPEASAAEVAELQEELHARLPFARGIVDALGGQLELAGPAPHDPALGPAPVVSLTLSLPRSMSAS